MTNSIAIWLAVFIAAFFVLDAFVLHLDAHLVILRLIVDAVNWLAFWR